MTNASCARRHVRARAPQTRCDGHCGSWITNGGWRSFARMPRRSRTKTSTPSPKPGDSRSRYRIDLGRPRGHEQGGKRLGLVVSPSDSPLSVTVVIPTSTSAGPSIHRPQLEIAGRTTRLLVDQIDLSTPTTSSPIRRLPDPRPAHRGRARARPLPRRPGHHPTPHCVSKSHSPITVGPASVICLRALHRDRSRTASPRSSRRTSLGRRRSRRRREAT